MCGTARPHCLTCPLRQQSFYMLLDSYLLSGQSALYGKPKKEREKGNQAQNTDPSSIFIQCTATTIISFLVSGLSLNCCDSPSFCLSSPSQAHSCISKRGKRAFLRQSSSTDGVDMQAQVCDSASSVVRTVCRSSVFMIHAHIYIYSCASLEGEDGNSTKSYAYSCADPVRTCLDKSSVVFSLSFPKPSQTRGRNGGKRKDVSAPWRIYPCFQPTIRLAEA